MATPHLRHVRLRKPVDGREHLLLVYGDRDQLICWCGPYIVDDAYRHALDWGSSGWPWPSGCMPLALRPPPSKQDDSQRQKALTFRGTGSPENQANTLTAKATRPTSYLATD